MNDKIATLKIIVGLGNPATEYQGTYHNAGHLLLNFLAGNTTKWKKTDLFRYVRQDNLILAKTDVFMNESGRATKKILSYFKLKPDAMAIAHDDSDLMTGEYKIQFNRGSAGHRGVASVLSVLKTKDFGRIRIGVRAPQEQLRKKAGDFVLKKIDADELKTLDGVFQAIALEIERERNRERD
jgi:PTH1 family peptidyl-tRNA hydrolase